MGWLKWTGIAVLGLILILVITAIAGAFYLSRSLPRTEGQVTVEALESTATITRGEHGIVAIRANSELDAYRALGFAHAQDRLWQMEMMRRLARGQLSALVGEATLTLDRMMRAFGFEAEAERALERHSPQLLAVLGAYAEGVNAFLEERDGPLPPEFQIAQVTPSPWRPVDSLLWGQLMALQLSGNWREEVTRARLADRLDAEQLADLYPDASPGDPVTMARLRGFPDEILAGLGDALPFRHAPKTASNWWVLDGTRTESGRPLLANDPHLGLGSPGQWYLVRIEYPGRTLAGVTAPGVPLLIIGHNGDLAWGFTTTHSDTQDLVVETVSEDGERYKTEDGWARFETVEHEIPVLGGDPHAFTVRRSRHGPILSDALGDLLQLVGDNQALALQWAHYAPHASGEALYRMALAEDHTAFQAAMRHWKSPQQNVAYADTGGTIAFAAPAYVPIRPAGDGTFPLLGDKPGSLWRGFVPPEDLPRRKDPPSGVLVNANNRIVGPDYPYLIAKHWPLPYRAERIEARLAEPKLWSLEAMAELQMDAYSLTAERLLPHLLDAVQGETAHGATARRLLAGWDRRMTREQAAPSLFAAWVLMLNRRLLADETGSVFADLARPDARILLRILSERQIWCDDTGTAERQESCAEQIRAALGDAVTYLDQRLGGDPDEWLWGRLHIARQPHRVFGRIPLLSSLISNAVATDGWEDTVNRGGTVVAGAPDDLFEHVHGPGLRVVFDLAELDNSRFMITPGQSGNPYSPHFGDLARPWRDGDYVKLVGGATDPEDVLRLTPR